LPSTSAFRSARRACTGFPTARCRSRSTRTSAAPTSSSCSRRRRRWTST
jgi:hypothetical protein